MSEGGNGIGRRGFNKGVAGLLGAGAGVGAGGLGSFGVERVSAQEDVATGPTVYVGSDDNTLYAVNAETGEQQWAFTEPSGGLGSSPTVVGGTVYVGSFDNTLYAVDSETGNEVWAFTEPSDSVASSPTVVDGTVYVGSDDSMLYAVSAETGEQQWAFTEPSGWVFSSPTVVDGTIYIGSNDGTLYAVSAETGEQQWAFETSGWVRSSPTVVGGTVYVGSNDGTLYAVDAETGEKQWTFTEPSGGVDSSPTVADGTVYVGSDDNTLYAVDAETGNEEWAFTEPSDQVRSSPTVVANPSNGDSIDLRVLLGTLGHHDDYRVGEMLSMSDLEINTGITGPDGIPLPLVAGGALGALGVVYGGYRLLSSGEDETKETDDTPTTATESATAGRSGSTDTDTDEKLREIRGLIDDVEDALSSSKFGDAASISQEATGRAERLYDETNNEEARQLRDEALKLRDKAREKKQKRKDLSSEITKLENRLDRTEEKIEDEPETALESLDTAKDEIESLQSETADFPDLRKRVKELESRHDELRKRAEEATEPETKAPESVPSPPRLSLEYDDIEQGEVIGAGGNADVYRATVPDNGDELTVAVKEPRMRGTLQTETVERMMEEAETWQQLDDHDHIVTVVDYDSEPLPWIAMEYMDGGHLGDRAGEMEFEQAVWTAIATTKGVRHAHRRGVAHLDLKPENVLMRTVEDGWEVPKVADWGLSKHLLKHSKSVEGMSPQYAAPEQFEKSYGESDDITDVYQLGAVFYEMFTGKPAFEGRPTHIMNQVLNEEPTPPSEVADLPSKIDEVLLTAMATEKKERYESVLYFRDALKELDRG